MVFLWNYDGVLETIYHMMWLKQPLDEENYFKMFLPHTIIFKNNMPTIWYFSSKMGEVLQKKKKNITFDSILTELNKNKNKSDIAAIYLYEVDLDNNYSKPSHILDNVEMKKTISKRVKIDYISYKDLADFILSTNKSPYGILQKFIEPYGEKNCNKFY